MSNTFVITYTVIGIIKEGRSALLLGICIDGRNVIQAVIKGAVLEKSILVGSVGHHVFRRTLSFRDCLIACKRDKLYGHDLTAVHIRKEAWFEAWDYAAQHSANDKTIGFTIKALPRRYTN